MAPLKKHEFLAYWVLKSLVVEEAFVTQVSKDKAFSNVRKETLVLRHPCSTYECDVCESGSDIYLVRITLNIDLLIKYKLLNIHLL